jgi:opacity protein-like surface antigen
LRRPDLSEGFVGAANPNVGNIWFEELVTDVNTASRSSTKTSRTRRGAAAIFASHVNVPNLGVAYANDHSETNFAWALYTGLAYDVTPGFTIDLSYRYTDLGDARSGTLAAYDGSFVDGAPVHIGDITSHDLMLGVRLKLGHEPAVAPMPVAFK